MKAIGEILDARWARRTSPPDTTRPQERVRCFAGAHDTIAVCVTPAEMTAAGFREFTAHGRRVQQFGLCRDAVTGAWVYAEPRVPGETHEQTITRGARDRIAMKRCEGSRTDAQRHIRGFDE